MFGLFGKNKRREPERTIPIASYGAAAREQAEEPKAFQIALSWKGLWALIGVFFLLQLWMFLIGMWAAQTIVFPVARQPLPPIAKTADAKKDKKTTPVAAPAPAERPAAPASSTATSAPPSSQAAPVAEANLPAPTAEVPPELAGDVDLTPGPGPSSVSSGPASAPVSGPVFGPEPPPAPAATGASRTPPAMTDTKKRRARAEEATDEDNMAIPPSW